MTMTFYPVFQKYTGQNSKVEKPSELIIRDEHAWKALWKDCIGDPMPTLAIDFTHQMVAVRFLGKLDYRVNFRQEDIISDRQSIWFSYSTEPTTSPGFGDPQHTTPYIILVIPASHLPLTDISHGIAKPAE